MLSIAILLWVKRGVALVGDSSDRAGCCDEQWITQWVVVRVVLQVEGVEVAMGLAFEGKRTRNKKKQTNQYIVARRKK